MPTQSAMLFYVGDVSGMKGGLKCNKCIVREYIYLSYKSVNLDVRNEMCL